MLIFLFAKIVLSLLAVFFLLLQSKIIALVFVIFIILDLIDSRFMGESYRPYDTTGDRIFTYANFAAFIYSFEIFYPLIIFIVAFILRDILLLYQIIKRHKYFVQSIIWDRLTILATAVFFVLLATNSINPQGLTAEIGSYIIASIIILQGYSKMKRIKNLNGVENSD